MKKYKTIKEVSDLLNINQHVIRYWDSKFEGLSIRLDLVQKNKDILPMNILKKYKI